jgi:hypothetical protein
LSARSGRRRLALCLIGTPPNPFDYRAPKAASRGLVVNRKYEIVP